jgi:hypothetical protein
MLLKPVRTSQISGPVRRDGADLYWMLLDAGDCMGQPLTAGAAITPVTTPVLDMEEMPPLL